MARFSDLHGAESVPPHPDLVIAALAEAQHEIVHREQLLAAGVTDRMIARRLATRRMRQLFKGVYFVGLGSPSEKGRFIAAVFAAGDGAALSHRSAAALRQLRAQRSGPVEVTVTKRGVTQQRGIRVHVTRSLAPADVTVVDGIPCTSVPRTLVDLAAVLRPTELRRALEQAQIERVFDGRAIAAALARANGRKGTGALRRLLAELDDEPAPARSELERLFLDLVRTHSLPRPITNAPVLGHEVDFHWREQRLIVETDGRQTHDTQTAFETDRRRDLDLALAGWRVIRVTWRQLTREPGRVAELLRRCL